MEPGFRGCAFQNAAIELADPAHAGTEFVRGYKRRFGEFVRGLVEQSVGKGATKKRAHNPLLVAAGFDKMGTVVPWLGGKRLRIVFG